VRATFKVKTPEDMQELCALLTGIAGIDKIEGDQIVFTITDVEDEYELGRMISDTEREIEALGNRQSSTIVRIY
jgi:hypothetical protein